MQNKRVPTCVVALISASLCVGCSKDERSDATGSKDGTAKKGDASGARANKGANKHAFGLALTRFANALEITNWDQAITMMAPKKKGGDLNALKRELSWVRQSEGISVESAKALVANGSFGKAAEITKKGKRRAEWAGFNPDDCYAMKHKEAEVIAHWDGKTFKFFRVHSLNSALSEK